MKTILTYFSSGLALILSLGLVSAQSPSRPTTHAERAGQSWLTNYYGKTLSSLGEIIFIRIESRTSASTSTTNRTHSTVWRIIEHSKIQDLDSMSVMPDLPPVFSIEYADGLQVSASHYMATITLPNGRKGLVALAGNSSVSDASPNKSPEPTAVGAGRSAVAVRVTSRRWLSFLR